MLIGLFTLLAVLLGGGAESPYVVPNADKIILSEISDKARKAEAKALIKVYKRHWKDFQKFQKSFQKDFKKASANPLTSIQDLEDKIEAYRERQKFLDEKLIPIRLEVMDLMTDQEWEAAMGEAMNIPVKEVAKQEKDQIKAAVKQSKKMVDFRGGILMVLEEEDHYHAVFAAVNNFENQLANILYQEQDMILSTLELIKDRGVTQQELAMLGESYLDFKTGLSYAYLDLREVLLAEVTEDQWKKLHKELDKLL
jgi:hypothetical protein